MNDLIRNGSRVMQYYLWILAGDIQDRIREELNDERQE